MLPLISLYIFKIAAKSAFAELVTEVCGTLAIFGSFAFFAYQTVLGSVTLGDLVMYYMVFQRAQGCMNCLQSKQRLLNRRIQNPLLVRYDRASGLKISASNILKAPDLC